MENIEKNNKLIAEFMEWYVHPELGDKYFKTRNKFRKIPYWCEYNTEIPLNELNYHSSWDWLMPAVEKIELLGFQFYIVKSQITINKFPKEIIKLTNLDNNKIDATYTAVIKFIKWYNKQKNNGKKTTIK